MYEYMDVLSAYKDGFCNSKLILSWSSTFFIFAILYSFCLLNTEYKKDFYVQYVIFLYYREISTEAGSLET